MALHKSRHTSSLSLPIKSSSGWASCRLPLLLSIWSFPIAIFSWSPWPCPCLGECGWDKKENTSSCRVSCGSDPSLFSQLLQTCRSQDKPGQFEHERGSAVVGVAPELSFTVLQLHSSERKDYKPKPKQGSFNLSRSKFSLAHEYWWNKEYRTWINLSEYPWKI